MFPAKPFPYDVRHDYDGNPCSHRKAHNIYGMQMARATYQGVKKFVYPKRPFVITRAAYSGTQRYTSTWTGDNVATWEHLWIANHAGTTDVYVWVFFCRYPILVDLQNNQTGNYLHVGFNWEFFIHFVECILLEIMGIKNLGLLMRM